MPLSAFLCSKKTKTRWVKRLEELYRFDASLHVKGYRIIAGVDEAGRGALAGPVAVSAVILPEAFQNALVGLDDSKKLTPQRRAHLYRIILSLAIDVVLVLADEEVIESMNILETVRLSMIYAVNSLSVVPELVIVDNVNLPGLSMKQLSIPKADSTSATVAAASIVAKVARDRVMESYGNVYGGYNFQKNKGYGTAEHRIALKNHGLSPIHRRSFCSRILNQD